MSSVCTTIQRCQTCVQDSDEDDDQDWEDDEDEEADTLPLDDVDVFELFASTLRGVQSLQPQRFQSLTASCDARVLASLHVSISSTACGMSLPCADSRSC